MPIPSPSLDLRRTVAVGLALVLAVVVAPSLAAAQQLYDFGTGFGRATAVAGDQLLVAQPQNVLRAGEVYVFDPDGGAWTAAQTLTASDAEPSDGFGRALAGRGDWMVVGAPRSAEGAGTAYLFRRGADGWEERARLEPTEGAAALGGAVAVGDGFVAMVEQGPDGEEVRVLRLDGDGAPVPDGVLSGRADDDRFGGALAFAADDALAVCGADAEGKTFVELYVRGDGVWTAAGRAFPGAQFSSTGGLLSQDPYKECALSASGDRVAVGTPLGGQGRGTVTTFRLDAGADAGLVEEAELAAPAGAMGGFGTSVALAGDVAWVGAPNAGGQMGAVARFQHGADGWSTGEVLEGPGTDFMPVFGLSLAASDEVAVVGSPGDAYGAGVAVAFEREAGSWVQALVSLRQAWQNLSAATGEILEPFADKSYM